MEREFWSNSESCLILKKSKQCLPFHIFDDIFNAKGFHVKVMDILESYPMSEEDIKHVSNCMDIIPKVFSQGGRSN